MSSEADGQLQGLQETIARLAEQDALELLAEARAEARARIRAPLTDALTDALRKALEETIERRPEAGARGAPSGQPTHGVDDKGSAVDELPGGVGPRPLGRQVEEREPIASADAGLQGTYVYGVVWSTDVSLSESLSGLDADDPVRTVTEGPVAAVTCRVPLAEFEEEALRGHLSDIDWVERVARAHEAVLDDLCSRTVVVPMRMCTVYRDEENLRSMLRSEQVNLRVALEFLDGKVEWGVKAIASGEGDDMRPPDAAGAADDARSASSGVDYMARRRARRDARAEADNLQADAAAEIHDALSALAHDGLLNPTQSRELPGQSGRMVMNGVYLVEREVAEAFHQEVCALEERFGPLGLELVESGPWPPYNFVPGDVGATW